MSTANDSVETSAEPKLGFFLPASLTLDTVTFSSLVVVQLFKPQMFSYTENSRRFLFFLVGPGDFQKNHSEEQCKEEEDV